MKARHILVCLALSLLELGLQAQIDPFLYYDIQDRQFRYDVPQVFTPEAASLGEYGNIPVSYYNGIPEISLPLTELKAAGHTIPISLSYHAGGHKTETRPGWVGLGWTLMAGGCINRIVHGYKDEMTIEEAHYSNELLTNDPAYSPENLPNPGFLYHPNTFSGVAPGDTSSFDQLCDFVGMIDYEPDEFQICIDAFQGSFYFGNDGLPKVCSKGEPFEVIYTTADYSDADIDFYIGENDDFLKAHYFTFIDKIILKSIHGEEYEFGGTMDAIDFSYIQTFSGIGPRIVASANTWFLREIRYPNGEVVSFEYEKKDFPVIVSDVHTRAFVYYNVRRFNADHNYNKTTFHSENDYLRVDQYTREKNQYNENEYSNLSYTILHPSYLKSIHCRYSKDEIHFVTTPAEALINLVDPDRMQLGMGRISAGDGQHFSIRRFLHHNQYHRLDYLVTHRDSLQFQFRTTRYDNNQEKKIRLRLIGVSKFGRKNPAAPEHYHFEYDSQWLPSFNAKLSDHWGYYNGVYYGGILPNINNGFETAWMNSVNQGMLGRRQPDANKMKSEILVKIEYPTGGFTQFVYEPHRYNRIATQFSFNIEYESGMAGGLRIKEIVDSTETHTIRRRFTYNESGILSGKPIYAVAGSQSLSGNYDCSLFPGLFPSWNENGRYMVIDTTYYYRRATEYIQNQLSTTHGSHVVYDTVTETRSDSSRIVYHYTSYEEMPDQAPDNVRSRYSGTWTCLPYTSHEHGRGLLLSKSQYDSLGKMVSREEYQYEMQNDNLVNITTVAKLTMAAGTNVVKAVSNKIRLDYPRVKRKIITTYPDDSGIPHVEAINYNYTSYRLLRESNRMVGNITENNAYTYPWDYSSEIYLHMANRNFLSVPIEHIRSIDGMIVEADLTTWKQDGAPGDFVPAEMYQATPTDVPDFNVLYDGTNVDEAYGPPRIRYLDYDAHSNLLRSATPDGVETTYTWDKDSTHIRGLFMGAGRKTRYRIWSELARVTEQENLSLIHDRFYVGSFTSVADGAVTVNIWFDAGDERDIWGKIDSLTFHCPSPSVVGGLSPVYTVTFQLEAGRHTLLLSTREGVFPPIVPILNAPDQGSGSGSHIAGGERPLDPLDPIIIIDPNGKLLRGHMSLTYWGDPDYVHERDEQECAHYGFEGTGDTPDGFESEKSQQSAVTVHLVLNPDLTYTLDRRVKRNGKWVYERMPFVVNTTDQYELYAGGAPFDEVRIYADRVQPETYTWWPDGNLRSRTDARGVTESYEYDGLGRLIRVYDNERKKVEEYMYNYQNK